MQAERADYLADQVTKALWGEVMEYLSDQVVAAAVGRLLRHVRALHRALDSNHLNPGTEVILAIDRTNGSTVGVPLESLSTLVTLIPAGNDGISIRIAMDGTYRYEFRPITEEVEAGHIKYVIEPFLRESVITPLRSFEIDQMDGVASPFAITYFRDLNAALENYYVQKARQTLCPYLEHAWGDGERRVLSNKPENHMRRSLHDFLRTSLRDADPIVLQEQNVDETKPVDIRVQWLDANRTTLIEVKWIGDSLSPDGQTNATAYRDARAKAGYTQLLDYVHAQRLTLPGQIVRGRLVVFDARRGGLEVSAGVVTCADDWQYELKELDYSSVLTEDDAMEEPIRYFMEPVEPKAA